MYVRYIRSYIHIWESSIEKLIHEFCKPERFCEYFLHNLSDLLDSPMTKNDLSFPWVIPT